MRLFDKRTPLQKEWDKLEVQEQRFLRKRLEKKESILNQKLEEKISCSCKEAGVITEIG